MRRRRRRWRRRVPRSTQLDNGRLSRAFRVPRNVDMIVEINMVEGEASEYRAAAARLHDLALDRPDILFASKECSRRMSAPRHGDWVALQRVVRHLLGKPSLVWRFTWQGSPKVISAFCDSKWAGCHDTRKSTSGACIMNGSHLNRAHCRTQSSVALALGRPSFTHWLQLRLRPWGLLQ